MDDRTNGRAIIRDWCDRAGEPWHDVASGRSRFRLQFGKRRVLYCYDTREFVSAWVDIARPEDAALLLRYGSSRRGYQDGLTPSKRGIRLQVKRNRLDALLDWCAAQLSPPPLDYSCDSTL